jgi:hypothetical protein
VDGFVFLTSAITFWYASARVGGGAGVGFATGLLAELFFETSKKSSKQS